MLVGALVQAGDDVCAAGVEMVVGKLVVGILLIAAHLLVSLLSRVRKYWWCACRLISLSAKLRY